MRAKTFPSSLLIAALFVAGSTFAGLPEKPHFAPGDPNGKITSSLRQTLEKIDAAAQSEGAPTARLARQMQNPLMRVNEEGEIQIYLKVTNTDATTQDELAARGARIVRFADDLKLIEAWILPDRVREVAAHPSVTSVRPVIPPVSSAGSVMTEGDAILGADRVRALGFDGSGVKVGVISDDVDNGGAAVATGDLPQDVVVLQRFSGQGDEGTAMLEIVHDIAPGADLYFYSGFNSSLDMRNGIYTLAAAGCKVIVDDVGHYDQPFYEDGFLAQAVDEVAKHGVVYCSAAGNAGCRGDEAGQKHYEYTYTPANGVRGLHAWDGVRDSALAIVVDPGSTLIVNMQWDDPFGKSSNDYDLYLCADAAHTTVLESSRDEQSGTQNPREDLSWSNTSVSQQTVYLVVNLWSGQARRLGLYVRGAKSMEWFVQSGSIFGHPAALGAIAVGAIDADNPGTIAKYSSRGPVHIAYPVPQTRGAPDVVGVAGVHITGAGNFSNPFYGTSAAAPHVAAVAALIRGVNPLWTPEQVRSALTSSALDMGDQGPDFVYGYGRVHAVEALARLDMDSVHLGPTITSVRDVPNDQGGRVAVRWNASSFDTDVNGMPKYSVWRALPIGAAKPTDGGGYRVTRIGETEYVWEWLADCPALKLPSYGYTAETLFDSMSTTGGVHHFMVVAHTYNPDVFFMSDPVSGYSVDNLAPAAPKIAGIWSAGRVALSWGANSEPDLKQYVVYRSGSAGLDPSNLAPLIVTTDTMFVDEHPLPDTTYYVVVAQDIHGNLSLKSNEVTAVAPVSVLVSSRPVAFTLSQNTPNPFNPSTTLRFGLPEAGHVTLAVYDVNGRLVRALVGQAFLPGQHEVVWDGRDGDGREVASGVYMARLTAPQGVLTRRMVLLR